MPEFNYYPINRPTALSDDFYHEHANRPKLDAALKRANRPLTRMEKRVKARCESRGLGWAQGETVGFISKKRRE